MLPLQVKIKMFLVKLVAPSSEKKRGRIIIEVQAQTWK